VIEFNRYIRVKPQGLVHVEATEERGGGLWVIFKRFDVENGREIEPERSFLSFTEIHSKLSEMEAQIKVLREFARLSEKA
jgi:hypothetical protein